jgi:hypothetical protein
VYFLAVLAHLVEWSALRTVPIKAAVPAAVPAPATAGAPPPEHERQDPPAEPSGPDESTRFRIAMFGNLALGLTVIGAAAHFFAVFSRAEAVQRVPWGNMYEFTISGSFVVMAGYLLLRKRYSLAWMGPVVTSLVLVLMMVAVLVLYTPVEPLTEALRSPWLVVHVMSAMIATGAFTLGGITSALYLVRARAEKRGRVTDTGYIARLPSLASLDRVSYRIHAFAFPVWTDLGARGLVVVLELGPEGGLRVHHLGGVRRLPARPRDGGLARPQRGDPGPDRGGDPVVQLHRDQLLLDHQPALLRQRHRGGQPARPLSSLRVRWGAQPGSSGFSRRDSWAMNSSSSSGPSGRTKWSSWRGRRGKPSSRKRAA